MTRYDRMSRFRKREINGRQAPQPARNSGMKGKDMTENFSGTRIAKAIARTREGEGNLSLLAPLILIAMLTLFMLAIVINPA